MKNFISITLFGVLNYVIAIVMMASPWIFGFYTVGGGALLLPIYLGWLYLIMAIFSANKVGFIPVFPIQMHLVINVMVGPFLLASPWLYGFASRVFLPHLILGLLLFLLGIFTKRSPLTSPTHHMLPEAGITSTDAHEGRMTT